MATMLERLEDGLFQKSRNMAPPWGPVLRVLRYPVAILRDWLAGEISVQAMSLAYTTLLSLVPLMVFSFAILKGIGARSDLQLHTASSSSARWEARRTSSPNRS